MSPLATLADWYQGKVYVPVEFGYSMSCSLADIRRHVHDRFLDGQHHDGHYHWHSDAGENTQCTGSDQLIRVLEERWGVTLSTQNIQTSCIIYCRLSPLGLYTLGRMSFSQFKQGKICLFSLKELRKPV